MIWLEELQTRKKISRIFSVYEKTFPEDERRSKEQFLALAENPDVFVFSIQHEQDSVGYAVIWKLSDFYFLEHFEVFEQFRNQNLGSQILTVFKDKFAQLVLETEPDDLNEIAKRRVEFYKRNGFAIIDETYIQPPYEKGKSSLNLYLLANFHPKKIDQIKSEIYDVVYC